MIIPIYDVETLPKITYPMRNTHRGTKRYLGGHGITMAVNAEINVSATSEAEIEALYDFWATKCSYGLEPFLIPLPLFGRGVSLDMPDLLVRFIGEISAEKTNGVLWSASFKLKVFGTIDYVIDGGGNFVVSDAGEWTVSDTGDYIPTGNVINSYREVIYA